MQSCGGKGNLEGEKDNGADDCRKGLVGNLSRRIKVRHSHHKGPKHENMADRFGAIPRD